MLFKNELLSLITIFLIYKTQKAMRVMFIQWFVRYVIKIVERPFF